MHVQGRAEATRRSLLEAAAHLFNERGYAGTSISDISELSGRTSGAVYFHYTSKEMLALAVVEAHFATWPKLIERHDAAGLPALERLVRLSFAVARAFRDDIVVRAGARLWSERRAINETLPTPFVGWIGTVRKLLHQARADGELAPHVDPARDAHSVVCAFFGLHTVSDALEDRLGLVDQLADLWLLLLPSFQNGACAADLVARARAPLAAEEPAAPARPALPADGPPGDRLGA
jgi:AcrR family transcriptional regulator